MCFPLLFGGCKRDRVRSLPTNPPKPRFLPRSPTSQELRNEQAECPLFSLKFPAELRLSIYEAVLGDMHRFTHVIPFDDKSNRVGRRRCKDTACEGPTWQHTCFGAWLSDDGSTRNQEYTFYSRDQLLNLLLSCHRMSVCLSTFSRLCLRRIQIPRGDRFALHGQQIQRQGVTGYLSLQCCYTKTSVAPDSLPQHLDNVSDTTEILAKS
jgi:hypothetical protein